jgi:hypothetical protein
MFDHGRRACLYSPPTWELPLGVFEFIVVLVLISTVGKVLTTRRSQERLPRGSTGPSAAEVERLREVMDELSGRLHRLEEERDFYRDLLEAPRLGRRIPPPEGTSQAAGEEGHS